MMKNDVIYLETASIWHNLYIISVKAFSFYMVISSLRADDNLTLISTVWEAA